MIVVNSVLRVAALNRRRIEWPPSTIVIHRVSLEGLAVSGAQPICDELLDGVTLVKAFAYGGPLARVTRGACPYHVLVRRDGAAEQLLPLDTRGAHARGHNSRSIGVAYAGMHNCLDVQHAALVRVVSALSLLTRGAAIRRHDDLDGVAPGKVCPHATYSVAGLALDVYDHLPARWRILSDADVLAHAERYAPGLVAPGPMRRHHA